MCLTGPSGCGKTTLLKIIAGIVRPTHGQVRIKGEDASHIPTCDRQIGFVFQSETALFPHLNVRDNISFSFDHGRRSAPDDNPEDAVEDILQKTGLSLYRYFPIAKLSGGLKQRVAIARALVYEPAILLLDEPFSSLDNPRKQTLISLLLELKQSTKHTFLYVTHDDREITQLADTVAILDDAHIVQDGPIDEVLQHPVSSIITDIFTSSRGPHPAGGVQK
jgi:ABC-type sulfate/molybdate transport systems ATPase subunit